MELMHELMVASGQMQDYLREVRELQIAIGDLRTRRLPGVRMRPQEVEQAIIGLTLNAHLNELRRSARRQLRHAAFNQEEARQARAPRRPGFFVERAPAPRRDLNIHRFFEEQ